MQSIEQDQGTSRHPKHEAYASFSRDMVQTMEKFFDSYQKNGCITIEVTEAGLWLRNPMGGQQFLGLAYLPSKPAH